MFMRNSLERTGFSGRSITRRGFLGGSALAVASLGLADILAACSKASSSATTSGAAGFDWANATQNGHVTWGTWPFYLDTKKVDGERVHPTLVSFSDETGITVDYREVINEYATFYAKLRPSLDAGQSTGYDVIVMGYPRWLPLMMQKGYLLPVDQSRLQNFNAHAGPPYKDRSWDPGNVYSIPYQSGITGIGYNPDLTGREITSYQDLLDPAFAGKVGMFNDTEDLPNLALLGMGVEPSESTPDQWTAAAQMLTKQRDDGIVRQYYGQGYLGDLQRGDLALTMAWAADILISNITGYPNLKFVVPDEGALLWTDCLCIPVGAENPVDAMMLIDHLYDPEVAAGVTDWVQAVSPVPEAKDVLVSQGEGEVAKDPLVFPTDEMYTQLHDYRILTTDEQQTWDDTFIPVVEGG
jgi:spermidine/putrescine transport system substrate-binding protein